MILEIHGAGFKNKGAEMMLRTVISELGNRLPGFVLAIDPSYGRYEQRAALGLYQIFPQRSHVGSRLFSWRFKHQRLLASLPKETILKVVSGGKTADFGYVTLSDIQGFIDIAGFAYTSHWGNKPTQDLAQLARYFRKNKKPVILMPQAFGPFETQEIRSAVQEIINNASLIFARDAESYNYLQELSPTSNIISQAPDITLFYPKKRVRPAKKGSGTIGIVPNARILDQGKEQWGNNYYDLLVGIISNLLLQEVPVEFIIHDASGQDRILAEVICNRFDSSSVPIIWEPNPVLVKKRISNYQLLIGSRYHSLTAALSTEVPVIALGWAHKYERLMEEFNLSEYLLAPDISVEEAVERVEHLLQADVNEDHRKQIARHLEIMSAANQEMWNTVINILKAP